MNIKKPHLAKILLNAVSIYFYGILYLFTVFSHCGTNGMGISLFSNGF
jgi:cellulose synthase/poly-beta-1,6-N-acetylglucosamine synthase-like glycosyltransferase